MIKNLSGFKSSFKEYTELRAQENRQTWLSLLNGNVVSNGKQSQNGISARIFKNGYWGFASSSELKDEEIAKVIKAAEVNALFLGNKANAKNIVLPTLTANSTNEFFTTKPKLDSRAWVEFAKEIDNYMEKKYPNLKSRTVGVNTLEMEKNLITSDGSIANSMIPRSIISVSLTLEKNNEAFNLWEIFGGFGQFEDHFDDPQKLFGKIDEVYEHLAKKTDSIYAKAGVHDVVMDSDLAGILAHEAIGHTTEADMILAGSVAADNLGKKVASDLITLVDYANTLNGETLPVPVYIDDEGTKAEDVVIIQNGFLNRFMHSKETASKLNAAPTGNARAYAFNDEPLVRMRNTAIKPGNSKLEEMISSIEDGYYLMKSTNGQADSTSEFMFGVGMGYEIKNGKLGKALRDTTISGVAFDMLKTVTMVSDDMSWSCAGMCGKKQMIPVGMGGPALKCKINIGGR